MIAIILLCTLSGVLLSLPIIRAMRRDTERLGESFGVVLRTDYLRTRRVSRLSRVSSNSFGVRL
jgi:hypothetical protein